MSNDPNAEPIVILEDDAFNDLIHRLRQADDLPREARLRVMTLHLVSFILSHSRIRALEANTLQRLSSIEAVVNQMREPAAIQIVPPAAAQTTVFPPGRPEEWRMRGWSHAEYISHVNYAWSQIGDLHAKLVQAERWVARLMHDVDYVKRERDLAKAVAVSSEREFNSRAEVLDRDLDRVKHERDAATAHAVAMERERNDWQETASTNLKGQQFYHDLLTKAGDCFGVAARTSDDGTVQQDVLALKVPELVQEAVDLLRSFASWEPGRAGTLAGLRDRARALLAETPKGS